MKLVDEINRPKFEKFLEEQAHPQAVRILTNLRAYGTGYSFCLFYYILEDENIIGGALVSGNSIIGYLLKASWEFVLFCRSFNIENISVNVELPQLEEYDKKQGLIFYSPIPSFKTTLDIVDEDRYFVCYKILKESFSSLSVSFDEWYCDSCHMVRHGEGKLFSFDDKAMIFLSGLSSSVVVGSLLSVLPKYRKKGIGRRLLYIAAEKVGKKGKTLCCYSKNSDIDEFYRSVGWLENGCWYEYKRKG